MWEISSQCCHPPLRTHQHRCQNRYALSYKQTDEMKFCFSCLSNPFAHTCWLGKWKTRCASFSCCKRNNWMTTSSLVRRTGPSSNLDCSCIYRNHLIRSHRQRMTKVLVEDFGTDLRLLRTDLRELNSWPTAGMVLCWTHGSVNGFSLVFGWFLWWFYIQGKTIRWNSMQKKSVKLH